MKDKRDKRVLFHLVTILFGFKHMPLLYMVLAVLLKVKKLLHGASNNKVMVKFL